MSIDVERGIERAAEMEAYENYRILNSAAVASCVLGFLSAATLLTYEYGLLLGLVPMVGMFLGGRALWVIRRNPREMTGLGFAKAGLILSGGFLIGGLGLAGYVYATEVPDGYERITYSQLQADPKVPQQVVPPGAVDLDGKRVFIKGYVYPGAQTNGLKRFVLCRDNGDCCFGGTPPLTDKILVTLTDPLRLNYSRRMQRLAGTFRLMPGLAVDAPGEVVYQLEADYCQ
jgi:hypothetical protein